MNACKENPLHVMYDWETTDNRPTSAVASIAVILFRPEELKTFEELVDSALRVKFDIAEQFSKFGRTWNQSTIDWWRHPDQAEAYKSVIAPSVDDVSLSEFGPILDRWLADNGYQANVGEKIWTRGNNFDPPIFSSIYEQFGWEEPMPWWNIRDVRTEIDAVTPYWQPDHEGYGYIKDFPYPDGFIKHKEEHDCARDILMMQYAHIGLCQRLNNVVGGLHDEGRKS